MEVGSFSCAHKIHDKLFDREPFNGAGPNGDILLFVHSFTGRNRSAERPKSSAYIIYYTRVCAYIYIYIYLWIYRYGGGSVGLPTRRSDHR